jgi:AcrR family transcriptional regulator
MEPDTQPSSRRGRPTTTNSDEVARVALELFADRGFDATTMDDIARTAGVSRRTVFRYFPSKNELVWGGFDEALERLNTALAPGADAVAPPGETPWERIQRSTIGSIDLSAESLHVTRLRLRFIAQYDTLIAHGAPKLGRTQAEVAAFLVRERSYGEGDPRIQIVAATVVAAFYRTLVSWAEGEETSPLPILVEGLGLLSTGFAGIGA